MDAYNLEAGIRKLAVDWYRQLDVHAPIVELLPLLAEGDLEMQFPEETIRGRAGFESWYQRVIHLFFDEKHTVQSVDMVGNGNPQVVRVVVRWEASRWNAPAANSERLKMTAEQTWQVAFADNGLPVIQRYVVDALIPDPGSAPL